MSSTSPVSKKRSTSSTASKRNLKGPVVPTLKSRPGVTRTSSEDDELVVHSFESVWDAIEDDLAERQRMKVLSSLMSQLKQHIEAQGWTQKSAAKHLGVTQPRISDLMRGKINLFSIDALIGMSGYAGVKLEIVFGKKRIVT